MTNSKIEHAVIAPFSDTNAPSLTTPERLKSGDTDLGNSPTRLAMVAYAAPFSASTFLLTPTWFILPGIYGKYFGLELSAIAMVVFYSRLFDAITDPLIGYLSDRHRANGGSRKIWVATGGVTLAVSAFFFFAPPENVTTTYFLIWSFIFYLAFTVFFIPYSAWGSEIAPAYDDRTKIYGYRQISGSLGEILFSILPLLLILGTKEYTPEILRLAVYIGGVLMVLVLALSLTRAPAGRLIKTQARDNFPAIVRTIILNRPLLLFIATYLIAGLSFGMWAGLVFLYMDSYLGLGDKIAIIFVAGTTAGALSIPLWLKLILKTGKSTAFAISVLLYTLLLFCNILIEPGSPWQLALVLTVGIYACFACLNVSTVSMLGDIADYGILKFRKNTISLYFASYTLIYKISLGVGSSLALAVAGYFGFDPRGIGQDSDAVFGLRIGFIIIPVLLGLVATALIFMSPITKHRHHVIRKRIENRNG